MKKDASLKSAKKSMASFMTTRLSSARCERGPWQSAPPPLKVKTGKREREVLGQRGSADLGELLP